MRYCIFLQTTPGVFALLFCLFLTIVYAFFFVYNMHMGNNEEMYECALTLLD